MIYHLNIINLTDSMNFGVEKIQLYKPGGRAEMSNLTPGPSPKARGGNTHSPREL
jgi:hypothetical protein